MSTLTLRIITAVILAGGFLAVLFFAPVIYAAAFLSLALLIAIVEWAGFVGWRPWPGRTIYALVAVAAMLVIAVAASIDRCGSNVDASISGIALVDPRNCKARCHDFWIVVFAASMVNC